MAERVDPPDAWPVEGIKALRPRPDRLRMETARERAERSLFGRAAPAKLGRYVLLGDGVDGGMGIVYAAYDPGLHRKVALKVLHPRRQSDERAGERLIAEARALARLDHPNVVKVHDVITYDDQVVIVMEWVEGETLAGWELERARTWQEVVGVYSQAAQGLAAAHGVGVIHRDFKPSNAIIGNDGRVRVLDFGLARSSSPGDGEPMPRPGDGKPPELGIASEPSISLTETGSMVGTLAYAAPEQLAGEAATAASDQFSLGVSMYRALQGVAPFAGKDAEGMVRSIRSGQVAVARDGRGIPTWLRAIVMRTLAERPAARFPSMAALLVELGRPRGWRRWRIPAIVGAAIALVVLAWTLGPDAEDPLAGCDVGKREVGAVWNAIARAQVTVALHRVVTAPDASQVHDHVLKGIDDYRDGWIALHRGACIAYRRGEQSAALLDRQMLCMQKRLGDLRATVTMLEKLDRDSAGNAIDVVARMPMVADCADLESLGAEIPPPAGTAQRGAVDAVRKTISQAMALERAGQSLAAVDVATAGVEQAERSTYAPVIADADLALGRILMARPDVTRAIATLRRARDVALEHRQFVVATEAAARAIFLEGKEGVDLAVIRREADVFLSLSKALPGDHFAGPLLLNNLGTAYLAGGNRTEATRHFQAARAALVGVAAPDLELSIIDRNLAMVTSDDSLRESLARSTWERSIAALGESHLTTIVALEAYARYVRDPARALALLTQACRGYGKFHAELIKRRVHCESYRAFLSGELGDHGKELRIYDEIVALAAESHDDDATTRARLAAGYARLLRRDGSGAAVELSKVTAADTDSPLWWVRVRAAHAELGIGLAAHSLGHEADAARHLELALALYRDAITFNEETECRDRAALAQRALVETQPGRSAPGTTARPPL